MQRKPFPTRFSLEEMRRLRLEAQVVGWSVGQLIRFRALRGDPQVEKEMAAQLQNLKSMTQDQDR